MPRLKKLYHVSPENIQQLMPRYSPKFGTKGIFVTPSIHSIYHSWAGWATQKSKSPKFSGRSTYRTPQGEFQSLTLYTLSLPMEDYLEAEKRHLARWESCDTASPGCWGWDVEVFIPQDLMKNLKIVGRKTKLARSFFTRNTDSLKGRREPKKPETTPLADVHKLLKLEIDQLRNSIKFLRKEELLSMKASLQGANLKHFIPRDVWLGFDYEISGEDEKQKHARILRRQKRVEEALVPLKAKRDEMISVIDKQLKTMNESLIIQGGTMSIKNLIFEGDIEEVAEYPEGFDIEHFKSIPSFKGRVEYAKQHLGKMGTGSARVVLDADANHVIKIAKNAKGIAQNELEADVSRLGSDIIASVVDHDDEYFYLESEKASKMTPGLWKSITGWTWDEWMSTFGNYMLRMNGRRSSFRVPEDFEDIEETEFFNELVGLAANYDMPTGDLMRISSWGVIVRDGERKAALIDYGLSSQVFNDYYAPGRRR